MPQLRHRKERSESRVVEELLVPGLMVLLIALVYRRLIAGLVLSGGDLQLYFYPYWTAMTRAFHGDGSILWSPYLFAGVPLLANSQIGALYPLNWPFWLLASPDLNSVAQALHGSVFLHLVLAAVSAYTLARCHARTLATGRWEAGLTGLVYAGSGFLGIHVEHLNQLQALAWLPLLFLPARRPAHTPGLRSHSGSAWTSLSLPRPLSIVAFAMILLAGHTQMAFIATIGLVVWHGVLSLSALPGPEQEAGGLLHSLRTRLLAWAGRLIPFALAGLLAGAQLLPTLELATLSGRGAGFSWREAVSFSVPPWTLHRVLLPPYFGFAQLATAEGAGPEGVAPIGVLALILAGIGVWVSLRRHRPTGWALVALAAGGLFLALGGYNPLYLALVRLGVPGFAHFRAPARFLGLYVLGAAMLVGVGFRQSLQVLAAVCVKGSRRVDGGCEDRRCARLWRTTVRVAGGALVIVVGLELLVIGDRLPHAAATTVRAYTDLRPATAHLVASLQLEDTSAGAANRFMSITETLFELGDKAEIEAIYGDRLSPEAVWATLVAVKQREVLVPNLPLAFRVPAVDGYDGGLLPLQTYTAFSGLLVPGGTLDGRLREILSTVPEERWLDLLGVRYVLTDKTGDVWLDDVLYDRQFQPVLSEGATLAVAWLPDDFAANAVGVLVGGAGGDVTIRLADGRVLHQTLVASADPSSTQWLRWEGAAVVTGLEFRATTGSLELGGATLVDERLGAFYPLVLSGSFRLAHSGDVKVYEDIAPPPRVRLVHDCQAVDTPAAAAAVMQDSAFDPSRSIVLADPHSSSAEGCIQVPDTPGLSDVAVPVAENVTLVEDDGTRVVVDVTTTAPGYLVLADAWYRGWQVEVEVLDPASPVPETRSAGQNADERTAYRSAPLQADLMFRAVALARPGRWRVTFAYIPRMLYAGLGISLLGIAAAALYFAYLRDVYKLSVDHVRRLE